MHNRSADSKEKVVSLVKTCLSNSALQDFTKPELFAFAGQMLIRIGSYLHWDGKPPEELPEELDGETIRAMKNTPETLLIKAGWRIQGGE